MSDPFSTDHGNWDPGSAGRSSGFFAGLRAGYDQQYQVDSAYGVEDKVYDRWSKSLVNLERATGQKFDMPLDYSSLNNYVRASQGEEPSAWSQNVTISGLDPTAAIKQREPYLKANEAIKQLADPNIMSMEDIVKAVIKERAEVSGRSATVDETGGFMAGLGQFVGAVGGSFSERDPLLVGTLGFGGFGKTAAARIASEMGIIGGVEAVQQYGAVEPNRAVLGEEPGSPLTNVLFAMAGAGILRGGVEGLGKYVKGRRAAAYEANTLDLTDEMRVGFEAQPQSPSARAGVHLLDMQDDFVQANPHGGSEAGTRRFIAELEDVQRVMNGTTDTAIARFLPETPIEIQKLDADSLIVQAERPLVYEQLTGAQERLTEIDTEISRVQSEMANLTIADAIGRVDEASGDIARSLEADLDNPQLTTKQRQEITTRLDTIIESLGGAEVIARQAIDGAIKPKKVLQSLRASRKAAAKQFRQARNEFDTALADINRLADAKERIKRMQTVGDLGSQAKLLDEPPGEILRHDNVEAVVDATVRASEVVDDVAAAIVRGPEIDAEAVPVPDDGMIDLGNGMKVSKDFTINLEDEAGNSFTMTADDIMRDMKDDLALEEAVKVCSI